jgi:hypothetical protein
VSLHHSVHDLLYSKYACACTSHNMSVGQIHAKGITTVLSGVSSWWGLAQRRCPASHIGCVFFPGLGMLVSVLAAVL